MGTDAIALDEKNKAYFKKKKIRKYIFVSLMLIYPLLQFAIFWVYININTVLLSFQRYSFMTQQWKWIGFDNYRILFREFTQEYSVLRLAVRNSILFFPFNNFVLLPISVICAFILHKNVFMHSVFRVIFFFPSIISIVVLTMVFGFMFDSTFGPVNDILYALGLQNIIPANGWLGDKGTAFPMILLYCLWAGIGYNVVLLSGAIKRVPEEVIESAQLDGIGFWRELWTIVIPLIFPTITTLFVIGCTVVFTLFLQPMLLTTGGPNNQTMTIAYYIVQLTNGNQLEKAATMGIFFSVIGVPLIFGVKTFLEKITPQVES